MQNTTRRLWFVLLNAFAAGLVAAGCGGDAGSIVDAGLLADAAPIAEVAPLPEAGSACNAIVESHPNEGHLHTPDCTAVTYASNPPSSGTHYPDWAMYKTYSAPVPWGFLVHDLEHGAVVISYNCPEGCVDEVGSAQALIDGLPGDPGCGGAPMKIVLAPDPGLDVRWAASAWTWTLRAHCFDGEAFASFITAHYQGPDTEAACGGGIDLSPVGWCP